MRREGWNGETEVCYLIGDIGAEDWGYTSRVEGAWRLKKI